MTHDYLGIHERLSDLTMDLDELYYFVKNNRHVLQHALLVADRLTKEPSEGMIEAGLQEDNSHPDCFASHAELFKAMRSAMLAEIDGGVV
jgi:hypothetical protein